jgi:hypothetical protein
MKRAASSRVANSTPGPSLGSIMRVSLRLKSCRASARPHLTASKFKREVPYADHRIDRTSIRSTQTLTGAKYSLQIASTSRPFYQRYHRAVGRAVPAALSAHTLSLRHPRSGGCNGRNVPLPASGSRCAIARVMSAEDAFVLQPCNKLSLSVCLLLGLPKADSRSSSWALPYRYYWLNRITEKFIRL